MSGCHLVETRDIPQRFQPKAKAGEPLMGEAPVRRKAERINCV